MSETKIVTQKIFTGLQDLQSLLHHIEMNGTPHVIEIDLLLEKIRNIYGHALKLKITDLNTINQQNAVIDKTSEIIIKETPVVDKKIVVEPTVDKIPSKELNTLKQNQTEELIIIRSKGRDMEHGEQVFVKTEDLEELSKPPIRKKQTIANPLANFPKPETEDEEIIPIQKLQPAAEKIEVEIPIVETSTVQTEKTKKEVEEKTKPEKHSKKSDKKNTIIADQFENKKTSVNEKLSARQDFDNLASRLQERKISDLRKAINLNDKILFIRELFKGSYANYDETLQAINQTENFESADSIIRSFQWDSQNEIASRFVEIVKRKFV